MKVYIMKCCLCSSPLPVKECKKGPAWYTVCSCGTQSFFRTEKSRQLLVRRATVGEMEFEEGDDLDEVG